MTRAEALTEARRRWGKQGILRVNGRKCRVGIMVYEGSGIGPSRLHQFEERGFGHSWEAAFAYADRLAELGGCPDGEGRISKAHIYDPCKFRRVAAGQPVASHECLPDSSYCAHCSVYLFPLNCQGCGLWMSPVEMYEGGLSGVWRCKVCL